MTLGCRDIVGLHALVGGKLNDFKSILVCRDTEGLHAMVAGELKVLK